MGMTTLASVLPKHSRSEVLYCMHTSRIAQNRAPRDVRVSTHTHARARTHSPPGCKRCRVRSRQDAPLTLDVSIFKQGAAANGETGHALQEPHSLGTGLHLEKPVAIVTIMSTSAIGRQASLSKDTHTHTILVSVPHTEFLCFLPVGNQCLTGSQCERKQKNRAISR